MKANSKITPNRYRPAPKKNRQGGKKKRLNRSESLKLILGFFLVVVISLTAVFIHDFFMQSSWFRIRQVTVSGHDMATRQSICSLAGLEKTDTVFSINRGHIQKRIASHPWIESASVSRVLPNRLSISVTEHQPLAVVQVAGDVKLIINRKGRPFTELMPEDGLAGTLPEIKGPVLEKTEGSHAFNGIAFEAAMALLKKETGLDIRHIYCNENTGITVETANLFPAALSVDNRLVSLKLGFDRFPQKLKQAETIVSYMKQYMPHKQIHAMDLFSTQTIFVKTTDIETLHNTLEKGV